MSKQRGSVKDADQSLNYAKKILDSLPQGEELKKIAESEERFHLWTDVAPVGIYLTAPNGSCQYVNKAWKKMAGLTDKEAMGNGWLKGIHPDDRSTVMKNWNRMVKSRGKWACEYRFVNKQGKVTWVIGQATEILQNGKVVAYLGANTDNTERHNIRIELAKKEKILSESQKVANIGSYLTNFITGKWESSEMLDKIFGIDKNFDKSVEGWLNIVHPEHREMMASYFKNEVIKKRHKFDKEYKILRQNDKKERWVYGLGNLFFDKKGVPMQMIGTIQDITERKKAEEDLGIYKFLVDQSNEQIALADLYGVVVFTNGAWARAHGYKKEELIGKHLSIFHTKDEIKNVNSFQKILLKKGKHFGEIVHKRKDGSTFITMMHNFVLKVDGKPMFMVGMARDITGRKKAEETLMLNEERYRLLYETSPDAIMTLDPPTWKFTSGNSKIVKMFGLRDEKEFTTLGPWDVSPKYQPDGQLSSTKAKKMIAKAMKEGVNSFEWSHKKVRGDIFFATVLLNRVDFRGRSFLQARVQDITRAKEVEKETRKSEERYRRLFEAAKDAILILDAYSGKIVDSNPFIQKLLGYSPKELIGKEIWQISPLKDIIPNKDKFFELQKKRYVHYENLPLENKNGEKRLVEFVSNVYPVGDTDVIQCNIRDISDRVKIEYALKESELKYRTLTESSPDCVKMFDLKGNLLYMNRGGLREHRLSSLKSALSKNWSAADSIDLEYHGEFTKALKRATTLGKTSSFEIKHDPKYSTRGTCLETVVPIKDIRGKVVSVFAISRDITDMKKTEEDLRDSQNRLEATLNGMGDGLFVLDKNYKIIMFNPAASQISGFSESEALGKNYHDIIKFFNEKTKVINDEFIKETMITGKIHQIRNHSYIVTKDGKQISISTNAAPLRDKLNHVVGCVVAFRDVSIEREADRMKSEFVSVASHQLKTPLTGIKWFSELLLKETKGVLNDQQKDFLKQIYDSNQRLVNLVDDLLDVSHIETGRKFNVEKEETDLVEIVNAVLKEKNKLIIDKNISIVKCANAPEHVKIMADAKKIRHVFDNLISNAVKYSHSGSVVEIGCEHEKAGQIMVYIRDHGIGIPNIQQKRVFEKFFRADNAVKSQTDGTGLGLYIARAIVEAHRGKIWFESEEGKGTTLFFSLPTDGT